jgi:hypothetical protein
MQFRAVSAVGKGEVFRVAGDALLIVIWRI